MTSPTTLPPDPISLAPGDAGYDALLALAAAEARAALGKDVSLRPQAVDRSGHWAFVLAQVREPGGAPLSLAGTSFAEAAEAGGVSDLLAVLFRARGEQPPPDDPAAESGQAAADETWTVVDRTVLPADVAWLEWPQRHGAPSRLLGIG